MADVVLRHTSDGGEIHFANGQPETADGLETAAYLSLFGGNEHDSGLTGDESREWWGNKSEPDVARKYRSETQYLLKSLPPIPANLLRIQDAADRDLAWMVTAKVAAAVSAVARMPARNTISLGIRIDVDGRTYQFTLSAHWSNK